MKRPTILVDLDNVVYDWVQAIAKWIELNNASRGRSVEELVQAYKTWAVWEDWGIPKGEFFRWWRLGAEAGLVYGSGEAIAGAREALWKLSDAEWSIHICSHRLTKFGAYVNIMKWTGHWLESENIPFREISLASEKWRIQADAIIDDRKDAFGPLHKVTFEFPAAHNGLMPSGMDRPSRDEFWSNAWKEIAEALVPQLS